MAERAVSSRSGAGATPAGSQFCFRKSDVVGRVSLGDAAMELPGDNVAVTVELGSPVAMDEGLRFAVLEGGRAVGSGVVT